jgi:hypothetical protein
LSKGTSCAVFVPNQTVPVYYKNGAEHSFLQFGFSGTKFEGELTKATATCPLPKEFGEIEVRLDTSIDVTTIDGFWFDPVESTPSEFHAASSASIDGASLDGTTFEIDGAETVEFPVGDLSGSFPAAASAETLGELAVGTATSACESSYWKTAAVSIDQTACEYVLHADGTVDLDSCGNGGIVLATQSLFAKCTIVIPNQSGASSVEYRNHGVDGDIGVRATLAADLVGEVTKSTGICQYDLEEEVGVTQENVTDFLVDEGETELWFG